MQLFCEFDCCHINTLQNQVDTSRGPQPPCSSTSKQVSRGSCLGQYLVFKVFTPLRHLVDLLQHFGCLLLHIIWLRLFGFIMHCLLIVKLVLLLESYTKHFHLNQYHLLLLHLKAQCRLPSRADQLHWIPPSYICKQGC